MTTEAVIAALNGSFVFLPVFIPPAAPKSLYKVTPLYASKESVVIC